jgi:hypothetical protein
MKQNQKTKKTVLTIALIAILMLMLAACGGAPKDTTNWSDQLVGYWEEVDINNSYTFNADGTGNEVYENITWDMTWTLNGDVLTMDFPDTGVEEYSIIIKGDKLTVKNTPLNYEYIRK